MRSHDANPGSPVSRRTSVLAGALLLLSAACATPPTRDVIVLLPDDQGKTGAIVVSSAGVERRLDRPGQTVSVESGAPPGEPFVMGDPEVIASVGPALEALPKPPARFILYFYHDSAVLTRESEAQLLVVLRTIRERSPVDISVVGHTDTMGEKDYNAHLSMTRAKTVAAILAENGVDASILDITSHGKNNPLVPTGDQVSEPRNRRVEVTVR